MTPPIQPPPTYGWESLHRFQILKQNQSIFIGSSIIEFLLILGVPPERQVDWGRVDWVGQGWVYWGRGKYQCVGAPHADMHMHVKHDKHGCFHEGGHLQFLYMCLCACVHVWGHLPMPPNGSTHLPPPKTHREPKTPKFNKS